MIERQKIEELTKEAQIKVLAAEDLLTKADKKIQSLDKSSIAEIKALLRSKDDRLKYIMFGLMLLLGQETNWESVQSAVANANFLTRLLNIEKDKIKEPLIKKVEEFTRKKEIDGDLSSFSPSVHTLCEFLKVIEQYVKINLDISPVRNKVKKLNDALNKMEVELNSLKENARKTDDLIESLKKAKEKMEKEHAELQNDYSLLNARLDRATRLVIGLSSSKDNWIARKQIWQENLKVIYGNVIISSVFLNYMGVFSSEQREKLIFKSLMSKLNQLKINYNPKWNLCKFMSNDMEILEWTFQGLPDDQYSKENAIILKESKNWSLLIDPQGQGNNWLKNLENSNDLIIVDPKTQKLARIIENCIINGIPLLYQNIEKNLDPVLETLLDKRIKSFGSKRKDIFFLDKDITMKDGFKFYMTTKLVNPGFSPEIASRVTQINFEVMPKGLEEQLLSLLLKELDEKLEQQRIDCIETQNRCDFKLKELEKKILDRLNNFEGYLIDNINLIETLEESKKNEEEIKIKKETNRISLEKNKVLRQNYAYIGNLGSEIFFAISKMNMIEHVYQFTLEKFMEILKDVLQQQKNKKEFTDSLREKIESIDNSLRKEIYKNCSRSVFEKDQNLLRLLLATTLGKIDEDTRIAIIEEENENSEFEEENLTNKKNYFLTEFQEEMKFLIEKTKVINRDNQEVNPDSSWICQNMWDSINDLNNLPNFQGIVGSFLHNSKEWKRFFLSSEPEDEPLPSDWSQKIKGFSFLLIIKVIRSDRLTTACNKFVSNTLGRTFVQQVPFDLEHMYEKCLNKKKLCPLLILTKEGVDPFTYVEAVATKKMKKIIQISLGKGQSNIAQEKIIQAFYNGYWVYCGNIHLSKKFLMELELAVQNLRREENNPEFMLFLSAAPSENLPIDLLQICMLCTLEPIRGLKQNMYRVVNTLIPENHNDEEEGVFDISKYKKLIYGLSFFHAVLNERKRFGNLGWNSNYDFSDADFIFNEKILKEFVDKAVDLMNGKSFQWDAIQFLLSEVNYGGRVTDLWDKRLVNQYAKEIFCEQLISVPKYKLTVGVENSDYYVPISDEEFSSTKNNIQQMKESWTDIKTKFLEKIAELPEKENPDLFGQHINADISVRIEDSNYFLNSLLKTQRYSDSSSFIQFDVEKQIRIINEIRDILPIKIEKYKVLEKASKKFHDKRQLKSDPLLVCLIQEIETYNALLDLISEELDLLEKCIHGKEILTDHLERLLISLNEYIVPSNWKIYITDKGLFEFIKDLSFRVDHMMEWGYKGFMSIFRINAFIYPNGFLTAVMQSHSRKTGISLDNLKYEFFFSKLREEELSKPKDGVYIRGLFLEGGKWNYTTNQLEDADPMVLYHELPILHFKPTEKTQKSVIKSKFYDCPCYYAPSRKDMGEIKCFLFNIQLAIGQSRTEQAYNEKFFIKRGTSIVLSINQ